VSFFSLFEEEMKNDKPETGDAKPGKADSGRG
jgi:hypothetical protein